MTVLGLHAAGVFAQAGALESLWEALGELAASVGDVVYSLWIVLLPALPLVVWALFWLLAVDWTEFRRVLLSGGWLAMLLLAAMAVLVWGMVDPRAHDVLGERVENFQAKAIVLGVLYAIMLICGVVQLAYKRPAADERSS